MAPGGPQRLALRVWHRLAAAGARRALRAEPLLQAAEVEGTAAAQHRDGRPVFDADHAGRGSRLVSRRAHARVGGGVERGGPFGDPQLLQRDPAARDAAAHHGREGADVLGGVARHQRVTVRLALLLVRREQDDEGRAAAREHRVREAARHAPVPVPERVNRDELVGGPGGLAHAREVGARADRAQAHDQLLERRAHARRRRDEARGPRADAGRAQRAARLAHEGRVRSEQVAHGRLLRLASPPEHERLHRLEPRGRRGVAVRRAVGGAAAHAREVVGPQVRLLRRRKARDRLCVRAAEVRLLLRVQLLRVLMPCERARRVGGGLGLLGAESGGLDLLGRSGGRVEQRLGDKPPHAPSALRDRRRLDGGEGHVVADEAARVGAEPELDVAPLGEAVERRSERGLLDE